ncbi:14148_t:CDS:2 [Acaulospora colombiana]|uniref:14148_t:CDS:1 n=1 Tax=Acaulospora colombiana TaxID=27376 RepID=A0ACA9M885_9GLOM|nr:14148_t:CDS:2 [Acaulospora colombiana]
MAESYWAHLEDLIHSYFNAVQARFWTFEHYINWVYENTELPIWTACVEQFYGSLRAINKFRTTMLHAKSNKKAYAEATGVVSSKRQVKRKTGDEEPTKVTEDSESVLFDESNEDALIDAIDEFGLKEETILAILKNNSWFMDPSLVTDSWGEIQALGSKDSRNENADPFVKARMGRKVGMKGILTRTFNKFEALYGEVACGLCPLGMSLASQKNKYFDKSNLQY